MSDRRTGRYRFPGENASDPEIREFASRHFSTWSTFRTRHLARISRNIYYNLGKQWIELDTPVLEEGGRGYTFREQQQDADVELPMPVTNIIAPAVDVEFATLAKRQWVPKVPSFSRDPRLKAAAKVADDVLKDRLKKLYWPDIRDRFIMNLVIMGTATIHSYWEEIFTDTAWTAVEDARQCAGCGTMLASSTINPVIAEFRRQGGSVEAIEDMEIDDEMEEEEIEACPSCSAKLAPIDLTESQSRGEDYYGRALGSDLPKGRTAMEICTPYEYYPENSGVNKDATTNMPVVHGICKVRSLDWVEEHHPELIDKVEPEEPQDLLREHPTLGEWDIVGRYDTSYDGGVYDHHVRVYDLFAEPSMRFPDGRYVRVIGENQGLIPINDSLVRRLEGADGQEVVIPTHIAASAVWKPFEGVFWGKGLPDDLVSVQNRINGMDSQTIEARERMGSPNLLAPSDANLTGPEYRTGYGAAKVFYWDPSPIAPDAKPEVFGSILMPSGVYNERQACMDDATRMLGPADIESGEAPRNITTTSGLQILGEQAERRRATRERGITSVFQKVWEHQLKLLWGFRTDYESYEMENPDGSWEIKQYDKEKIGGQTKVEIERQAYIDKSILTREATREALTDGLYDPSSPQARRKLLELMDLPPDVNEDTNLQIEHAQRAWVDFVDDRTIPLIDTSIDDPAIRYKVLGTYLMQEEGKQLAKEALWDSIAPVIAGWEDFLMQLQAQDAAARQVYGAFIEQEEANAMYAKAKLQHQEAVQAWEEARSQTQELGQPMTQPPPQEPPQPSFLPRQPELQVYAVWQQMLGEGKALVEPIARAAKERLVAPEEIAQSVDTFMRFRAVFEAYRVMAPPTLAPGQEPAGDVAGAGEPPAVVPQGPPPTPTTPPLPESKVG